MLSLTRKEGQSIKIGDEITIHISQLGNSKVRIGIDAPDGVEILRSELLDSPPLPDVVYVEDSDS